MIHVVLLSGGSGTRLWPLSNNARSKQFLKVLRDDQGNHVSMVQRVFGQIAKVPEELDVTIATSATQRDAIGQQVLGEYALVLEPERRDTAPAIMLACEHLALEQHADADDTVVVMPIDTYAGQGYYDSIPQINAAVQSEKSELVLLGVEPTYPSEKYGYIVPDTVEGVPPYPVARFTEKPKVAVAGELMAQGALWNCGVFAFKLGYLLAIAKGYLDEPTFQVYLDNYSKLPKNSFDYEVVEKAESISVVPYSGEWKDLGTWNTLTEEMAEPYTGTCVVDEDSVENVNVINESDLPLVVAGISDAVVVATPDGILVSGKEASAHIKEQVTKAAQSRPMYERKRWGEYKVVNHEVGPDGEESLTKELLLDPGAQLSYQRHMHRREVWTVVSGRGTAVLDGLKRDVAPGSVIDVGIGVKHSLKAATPIRLIEVQMGTPLIEEDIERFGNYWG